MKDSYQTLRHSPLPSLCMSERTRLPVSVAHKPSFQSLTSSDDHTAVSSHWELGSWYLPDDLQAEWNQGLALGQGNGLKTVSGSNEATRQPELPMHYIPASRLRKTQKERTCWLWSTMTCIGRAISSLLFKTNGVETGRASN
jgi:hypothetical protein